MTIILQSLVILLSALIIFVIKNTGLDDYTPFILGAIILVMMMVLLYRKLRKQTEIFVGSYFEMFIITTVILLIIYLTGGITSPIFFLLYFLLFGIAFMFEPVVIFVMMIAVIGLFGQETLTNDVIANLIRMGSIVFLSPLAFFFGNEYKKRERLEKEIEEKATKIEEKASDLLDTNTLDATSEKVVKEIRSASEELKKEVEG